jgi:hypothetical protein
LSQATRFLAIFGASPTYMRASKYQRERTRTRDSGTNSLMHFCLLTPLLPLARLCVYVCVCLCVYVYVCACVRIPLVQSGGGPPPFLYSLRILSAWPRPVSVGLYGYV